MTSSLRHAGLDQGAAAAGAPGHEGREGKPENPPEHLPLPLHSSPWLNTAPLPGFLLFSGGFLGALLEDHEGECPRWAGPGEEQEELKPGFWRQGRREGGS